MLGAFTIAPWRISIKEFITFFLFNKFTKFSKSTLEILCFPTLRVIPNVLTLCSGNETSRKGGTNKSGIVIKPVLQDR